MIDVIAEYPIHQAIQEGVIVDYQITVVGVPLDNQHKMNYKGKIRTEKQQFDAYGYVINNMEKSGGNTMFLRLARMRIIQNSVAKLRKTKELLNRHPEERILVFCGLTSIADNLDIPAYHSKSSEKQLFQDFAEGKGNHLAVVKIGNTGVTYKPLNRVIINYFDTVIDSKESITGGGSDRYLSEDYMFCQMWRKMNGKIFLCPWMKTQHIGTYAFTGNMPAVAQYTGKL